MHTMRAEDNALIYEYNGEHLRIEPWGDNSFRVRAVMMGDIQDSDFSLIEQEKKIVKIVVEEKYSEITNGNITCKMQVGGWNNKARIGFYNQNGKLLLNEIDEGGALNLFARLFIPLLGGDFSLQVSFDSDPNEKLFGMGQYQQEILNCKGCNLELAHRNSQASIPFVVSNLGYGLLWHNPAIGKVSFGMNTTEWTARSTKQMDYWITAGDSPDEIMQNYGNATGKVPMMPEYGLGFWQCKLRYWNQQQLLDVAREYYRRNIPVDVMVCDFFHWPKMGDYRFDDKFFPDPELMIKELKKMGMELMVSVWPQVATDSENYDEMMQKGLLVRCERGVQIAMRFGGDSTFYDATNPRARDFVWEKCRENYFNKGAKLFWLDEAEPEYTVYDFDNYRYYKGTNLQIGNIYPQLFSRTFFDGQIAEGQEKIVNLVRCAWSGSQRYGALVWSGDIHSDWTTLRRQLCAGLNMGLAGIPWWTTDIGGFSGGDPSKEEFRKLLIRWFEWGTFCPVMRLHGDRVGGYIPEAEDGTKGLFTGGNNEVWSYGEQCEQIMEKYIRLREEIRPYVRSLMEEAHKLGRPVMRTMFYQFPKDEKCWECKDQYMFGGDMLIAPVLYEDAYDREVYLPNGAEWVLVNTGEKYQGGEIISVQVPIDVIPVFLRDGKISELIGKI